MLSIITWNGGEPVGFFLQSLTSPWFVSSWPLQTYFSPPSTFWPCLYSCLSLCPWLDTRLKPRGGKPGCCPPCPADICISYILDSFSWDPLLGVCPGITYISRISSQVSIGRKKCNCLVFHSKSRYGSLCDRLGKKRIWRIWRIPYLSFFASEILKWSVFSVFTYLRFFQDFKVARI